MVEYITSGESHGKGMTVTMRGIPAGLEIDEAFINKELNRRQGGYGRGDRMKIETDTVDIISGVREGLTIGAPITMIVWNDDWKNWLDKPKEPIHNPRPGHVDLLGAYKYEMFDDIRNVLERASARETTARVCAGAVAKLFLKQFGIQIISHVVRYGEIEIDTSKLTYDDIWEKAEKSDLRAACDEKQAAEIRKLIDNCQEEGDTLGGIIETVIYPVPPFLGSYQDFRQKLEGQIAGAVLAIQAMKGIEFGRGFDLGHIRGKIAHDEIYLDQQKRYYRKTNRCGGFEGGVTTGTPIVFRTAKKPLSSLTSPLDTVDIHAKTAVKAVKERSDVVALGAAGVVIEHVVTIPIMNAILERYGSDNMAMIKRNFEADPYLKEFDWHRMPAKPEV